ncbi:MAG TPA: TolC family protein [Candidatus Binatia bacterium]|nr:TolC family protein [Candidatus Binatia bacterium]
MSQPARERRHRARRARTVASALAAAGVAVWLVRAPDVSAQPPASARQGAAAAEPARGEQVFSEPLGAAGGAPSGDAARERSGRDDASAERAAGNRKARAGESPALERLTLSQCIGRALESAPEMAVARAEVGVGEAKLAEAKASRFFPEAQALNFFGLARRARGTVLNPLDTVDVNAYGVFNRVEVSVVQPLYTWGKITSGIEAATHGVEAQMAASRGVAADVIEQVKTLYYNVLLARSVEGILQETTDAFDSALQKARERREAGDPDITEIGILYLRVGVGQSAKELPGIRQGEAAALQALRRAMGADPLAPIDLRARRLEPEKVELRPLDEYAARLFGHNPSWQQIDAGVAAKTEELHTVEADFYPSFFLTGNFIYSYAPRRDRQLNPFAYDYFNVLEGPGALLGIRWLLNFHVTAAKADTARAELARLEAQKRQAQTGLPLELRTAYDKVVQTREALEKLEDARKAGRAILTLAVTNFDVGVGEPHDIMEGLGTYSRASAGYFEAVRDYDLALASLSRVLGEEVTSIDIPSSALAARRARDAEAEAEAASRPMPSAPVVAPVAIPAADAPGDPIPPPPGVSDR